MREAPANGVRHYSQECKFTGHSGSDLSGLVKRKQIKRDEDETVFQEVPTSTSVATMATASTRT